MCRWPTTYCWKALNEGYNFASDLIFIEGLLAKLWGSKVAGIPILAISKLPLVNPGTKSHLDVGPMGSHRVYYKGEGDGFPQVRAVVSLMSPSCPWLILAPKVLQLCTNHFVLILCRHVWSLSILRSPIPELQHTPLPLQSATSQGTCPASLFFCCFPFGTHIWVLQGVGSASSSKTPSCNS